MPVGRPAASSEGMLRVIDERHSHWRQDIKLRPPKPLFLSSILSWIHHRHNPLDTTAELIQDVAIPYADASFPWEWLLQSNDEPTTPRIAKFVGKKTQKFPWSVYR
jgi:hypothetical protein